MSRSTTIALLAGLSLTGSVKALDFDFSGSFTKDNDIAYFYFTVGNATPTSDVTVFSSSWLTGDPPMGFDPILAIWTAAGTRVAEQDDGHVAGSTMSNGVSYNHGIWDSYYIVTLTPGDYIATVGQFDNFAKSNLLSDGFRWDADPHFTVTQGYGGATQPDFNGVWDSNDPRTANYEFHLLNVADAYHQPPGVPDAGPSVVLLVLALGGLAGLRRRL